MTPESRLKLFREVQKRQPKTAEERLKIFREVQQGIANTPSPEAPGFFENLKTGAERGITEYLQKPLANLGEAIYSGIRGDTRPIQEFAELAGRGLLKTVSAFDPGGAAYEAVSKEEDPAIAQVKLGQQQRQEQVDPRLFGGIRKKGEELTRREQADPSLSGKLTRGAAALAVGAIPAVAAGLATGGSVPAITAATALQSAGDPENLAANVGLGAIPVPIGKAVKEAISPILQRVRQGTPKVPVTAGARTAGRGQLGPEPGSAGREIRTDPTLYDPLESGAFYEAPLQIEDLAATGMKPSQARIQQKANIAALESPLVQASEKTPVLETITALWKAGLLTSPRTHLRNVIGTGGFQISEEVAKIPAALVDIAASAVTGRRSITAPSVGSAVRSVKAAYDSLGKAKQILKTGADPDTLVQQELGREINSGSKLVDNYVNGVFRLLNAEDKVNRAVAYSNALADRASTQAINEAKEGIITRAQQAARATELRNNPTDSLRANAMADAEIAVFTNDNLVSRGVQSARSAVGNLPGGDVVNAGFDFVVPFVRTPTNIIARMLEYSPLGFGKNTVQLAKAITKKSFSEAEQRKFAQTFGRATIGSGLILMGYKLGLGNAATGLFERESPSRRERDKAAGRPPGAMLVGNRWYQLAAFAPLGTLIAIGATLAREDKQEGSTGALPRLGATAGQVIGESIQQQPLLEGAQNLVRTAQSGVTGGDISKPLGQFAGSAVPNIVSDVAEAIDPQQREREGFGAQIAARLPGVRQSLPPAIDALGQPIEDRGPVSAFLDPFGSKQQSTNPVINELVRLDQGLSKLEKAKGEDDGKFRERVQKFGQVFQEFGRQLINSAAYINASDEQKKKAIESFSSRVKVQMKQEAEQGRRAAPRGTRLAPLIVMRAVLDSERAKK